jgi:hypothetical protein
MRLSGNGEPSGARLPVPFPIGLPHPWLVSDNQLQPLVEPQPSQT